MLYIVGCEPSGIPSYPFSIERASHVVGTSGRRQDGTRLADRPEITKAEREHTPPQLAAWLVELAGRCAR
ncbi:hypothetical protein [Hydrogenophaga sp.]|uniref:hypothetical protein n=1 Tax=Hydrogenophaga sp. TaxID=1904254 RepID=UPI003D0B0BFC